MCAYGRLAALALGVARGEMAGCNSFFVAIFMRGIINDTMYLCLVSMIWYIMFLYGIHDRQYFFIAGIRDTQY